MVDIDWGVQIFRFRNDTSFSSCLGLTFARLTLRAASEQGHVLDVLSLFCPDVCVPLHILLQGGQIVYQELPYLGRGLEHVALDSLGAHCAFSDAKPS